MKKIVKLFSMVLLLCALTFSFACASPDDNDKNDNNGGNNSGLTDNEGNKEGESENLKPDNEPTYRTEAEEVEKINENSTFDLKFLEDIRDKDLSELIYVPWEAGCSYYNPKYSGGTSFSDSIFVEYAISAYPNYADGGQFVTSIYCSDPEVTFYGGYTIASGDAFLEELEAAGYKIETYGSFINGVPNHRATKDNIIITYTQNREFYVRYKVSNRDGIDF